MMSGTPKIMQIEFQPTGNRIAVEAGSSILDAARKAGVEILATCGGNGTCHACRILLIHGPATPPSAEEAGYFSAEEIRKGYRLACQTIPTEDCIIEIPSSSLSTLQRLQVEGDDRRVELDPAVQIAVLPMEQAAPLLTERMEKEGAVPPGGKQVKLVKRGEQILATLPENRRIYGLAVDIGSTKLAGYLVDLETGKTAARCGAANPQIPFGEDVVARISYANKSVQNALQLHTVLMAKIQEMAATLCGESSAQTEQVVDVVLVGNTVMQHLAVNRPVRSLGEAPYRPDQLEEEEIPAPNLGLAVNPHARVYLAPNIAGYVGGDHVAMCLASGCHPPAEDMLALDIGTNTEISLCAQGKSYSCSCASGPAFEGARIQMGMRAASGAIEKVELVKGKVLISTIDDAPPIGICGSGILDAIAVMLADGAIDERGVLQRDHPRLVTCGALTGYQLASAEQSGTGKPILVTRKDVHEIQLAKAAIRTGCEILLREAGYDADRLRQFIVAGAFGTYLDIESAAAIGMFPTLRQDVYAQVGNAAGAGARQMLRSVRARDVAKKIARSSQYIELTTYPGFMDLYLENLQFNRSNSGK